MEKPMEAEKAIPVIESNGMKYFVPKDEPIAKFCFLSMVTFGIYTLMWYYRQFRRMKEKDNLDLSPFWRSFFAFFWIHGLFKAVESDAKFRGLHAGYNATAVTLSYIVLTLVNRAPDPFFWISLFSFVPVIPVVQTANRLHKMERTSEDIYNFSGLEWFLAIAGSLVTVLALIGTFIPESSLE
jgi:hypothetical protein